MAIRLIYLARVVFLIIAASSAGLRALSIEDVAGELNGEPVLLAEVDDVLNGLLRERWKEIDRIARDAAKAICLDRALSATVRDAGVDAMTWRAELWLRANPSNDELEQVRRTFDRDPSLSRVDERQLEHGLRVRNYRKLVRVAATATIGGAYRDLIPEAKLPLTGEPVLPEVVAQCMGKAISVAEVESYASLPIYRRRAEVVISTCRQFEIDYSNPLLVERHARAKGVTVDQLMKDIDGEVQPSADEVARAAMERYGNTDPVSLLKSRVALAAVKGTGRRMSFFRELVQSGTGSCALALPAPPRASLRDAGDEGSSHGGMSVHYFANFTCKHCSESLKLADQLRDNWRASVRVELRHHFPDAALAPFEDAVAAECAARQGKLWEYARSRSADSHLGPIDTLRHLQIEAVTSACRDDPRVAVGILEDTEEALRLGFREAIPSWVIGTTPRRGFQGLEILGQTVRQELPSTAEREGAVRLRPAQNKSK